MNGSFSFIGRTFTCPTYKIDLISKVPLLKLYEKLNRSYNFNFICRPLQTLYHFYDEILSTKNSGK